MLQAVPNTQTRARKNAGLYDSRCARLDGKEAIGERESSTDNRSMPDHDARRAGNAVKARREGVRGSKFEFSEQRTLNLKLLIAFPASRACLASLAPIDKH